MRVRNKKNKGHENRGFQVSVSEWAHVCLRIVSLSILSAAQETEDRNLKDNTLDEKAGTG